MFTDDSNSKNLLKLGIDMTALPNNLQSTIKEYVEIQKATGLHDLDLKNLEAWHLNKKVEMETLEQDILKPLQRKDKHVDKEIGKEERKINALTEWVYFL